jgi:ATP-binding cassette, subfamily B, bacterial
VAQPDVLRRSLVMLRPARPQIVLAVVLSALVTLATLAGPWLLGYAIDDGLTQHRPDLFDRISVIYLVLAVALLVCTAWQTMIVGRVGEGFVRDLRDGVFRHLLGLSPKFFDRTPLGTLLSRMTSDVDALQVLVEVGLIQLARALLTLLLLVLFLFGLSWELTLAGLVLAPPAAAGGVWFRKHSRHAYLSVRERTAETIATLVEGINGIREIQATSQVDRMLSVFEQRNLRQFDANVRSVWVQARYLPVMEFVPVGWSCIALGFGGWLVARGDLTVGSLSAYLLYLQLTTDPIQSLAMLFNQAQSAGAALRKEFGVLDTPTDLPEGDAEVPAGGTLELHGVGFRYDGAESAVLDGVSLAIRPGETLALVGPTGAGKTTLAKLAARFYDPTEGAVTYGGVDLRELSFAGLRRRIVMVTQEGHLSDLSVRDNIRIARPAATDDEVARAVERIGMGHVFDALPSGLDSSAGPGGDLLSSGQRQLVALARAALVDSDVLILDEATSDLDPGTELVATRALSQLLADRTTIVIAHRLSTILDADRIAIVAEGGISELGTHEELVAADGRYAALYAGWLRGTHHL